MPKVFVVSDNNYFKIAIKALVKNHTQLVSVVPIDGKTYKKRKVRSSFIGVTIIDGTINHGNSLNDIFSLSSKIDSQKIVVKGNVSEFILSSIFIDDPTTIVVDNKFKVIEDKLKIIFDNNHHLLEKSGEKNAHMDEGEERYKFFIGYCSKHHLTSAEMKVLFLSLLGNKPSEISSSIGIKNKSISSYKSRALKKLGVSNIPANISSLSSLFDFRGGKNNEGNVN